MNIHRADVVKEMNHFGKSKNAVRSLVEEPDVRRGQGIDNRSRNFAKA